MSIKPGQLQLIHVAIGNRIESWRQDDDPNAADPGTARVLTYIAGGALSYVTASNNDSTAGHYYRDNKNYDGAGNETSTGTASRHDLYSPLMFEQRASYYDAAEQLRESERHLGGYSQSSADTQDDYGSYEEYRYDALGRRVFVVALGNGGRFAEQTLWDGDQMLYQRRDQYPSTTAGSGGYTGNVGYVNVPQGAKIGVRYRLEKQGRAVYPQPPLRDCQRADHSLGCA